MTETMTTRRPVWWDTNAGGWVWQLPGAPAPTQADSWAAAWAAVEAALGVAFVSVTATPTTPAPARAWWRGWRLS